MMDDRSIKLQIYHYREQGEWFPFPLKESEGKLWNNFCKELALKRPDNPNPTKDDLTIFFKNVANEC